MTKEAFDKATKSLKLGDSICIQGKRNGIHRPAYEPEQPFAPVIGTFIKVFNYQLYYADERGATRVKNFSSIEMVRKVEK